MAPLLDTPLARTGVNTVLERGSRTLNQLQAGLLGSSVPGTKRQCRCYRTNLSYGKRRNLNGQNSHGMNGSQTMDEWEAVKPP